MCCKFVALGHLGSKDKNGKFLQLDKVPYARHYKPRLVYFLLHFKDHFFVFKEVFSEISLLMYGLYSRAACNQERLVMVRVR